MALIERETAIEAALDWNVKPGGEVFNAIKAAIRSRLEQVAAIDAVSVIRCKHCKHCRLLNDGVSFECKEWEMDFYAPRYDASTYYCGDGKRRETDTIGRDELHHSAE